MRPRRCFEADRIVRQGLREFDQSHPGREPAKTTLANESSQGGTGMEAQIGDNIVFESERVVSPLTAA
jgi:hypothetical protein